MPLRIQLRSSPLFFTMRLALYGLALLGLYWVALGAQILAVIAAILILDAYRQLRRSRFRTELLLGEQASFLGEQEIELAPEFFDTPALMVLRYRYRTEQGAWHSLCIWPDSLAQAERRALSRTLRWYSFS
ncbi:MAG: protein YgfX [Pseudohongiellaceae bacterium]|nr:protein YgfX [Pseudohongiellaceae bacterium]